MTICLFLAACASAMRGLARKILPSRKFCVLRAELHRHNFDVTVHYIYAMCSLGRYAMRSSLICNLDRQYHRTSVGYEKPACHEWGRCTQHLVTNIMSMITDSMVAMNVPCLHEHNDKLAFTWVILCGTGKTCTHGR